MEQTDSIQLEPLLKAEDAARFLGMSIFTVKRMAHDGLIPSIAFPCGRSNKRTHRYRPSDLRAYIDGLQRAQQKEERMFQLAGTVARRDGYGIR
jgi:hypothetical protein